MIYKIAGVTRRFSPLRGKKQILVVEVFKMGEHRQRTYIRTRQGRPLGPATRSWSHELPVNNSTSAIPVFDNRE